MKQSLVLFCGAFISISCIRYDNQTPVKTYRNYENPESLEQRLEDAKHRNCDAGGSDPGIIGGTKLGSQSRIAAGMVILYDARIKSQCSGILVSSDIVLTAAHCLNDSDPTDVIVGFTTDFLCDWSNNHMDRFLNGSEKRIHPQYRSLEGATTLDEQQSRIGFDLALLKLRASAPWGTNPLGVALQKTDWPNESAIYLAGYGRLLDYRFPDNSDPMLRVTDVKFAPEAQSIWNGLSDSKGYYRDMVFFDMRGGKGACSGDSGGPVLIYKNGNYLVAGTASFVAPQDCTGYVAYSELYNLRSWLKEAYRQLSSVPDENPF